MKQTMNLLNKKTKSKKVCDQSSTPIVQKRLNRTIEAQSNPKI